MRISTKILEVNRQKLLLAFPINLKQDVEKVSAFLLDKNFKIDSISEQDILLNGQKLIIPRRVYFDISSVQFNNTLTNTQQTILNCIYLRHHNGFVRQEGLEKLISNAEDYYIIPYIFQLLGEYVVALLEIADKHINENTVDNYLKFCIENPKYRKLTESRMISYWNAYYRRTKFKNLNDYIGRQIFNKL